MLPHDFVNVFDSGRECAAIEHGVDRVESGGGASYVGVINCKGLLNNRGITGICKLHDVILFGVVELDTGSRLRVDLVEHIVIGVARETEILRVDANISPPIGRTSDGCRERTPVGLPSASQWICTGADQLPLRVGGDGISTVGTLRVGRCSTNGEDGQHHSRIVDGIGIRCWASKCRG